MGLILSQAVTLLVIACLVAVVARRLRLPYTVGLVLTGIALSLLRVGTGIPLSHDLIFLLILPPLLFEAALTIPWREFRQDALPVLVLAVLGVVVSAAVVAAGMVKFLDWPIHPALVFGALIAATDPVAVIALFKSIKVPKRTRLMVETESLLNDGVAAVLFGLVLAWDGTTAPSALAVGKDLAVTVGGGLLAGLLTAAAALALAGRAADRLVETVLTAAAAYGSFLLAEHLHVSGVLATVTAGIVVGRSGLARRGRQFLNAFWEFAAFIANSLIFLLIGWAVPIEKVVQAGFFAIATTIGVVLLSRAIAVYGLAQAFRRSRWAISSEAQHVLWWGGLRGALGLALALSLPEGMPKREEIIAVTFGVVVFSVVVQGLSMPALLARLQPGSDQLPR